jgi:Family of unknown function (DUF6941)
MRVDCALLCDSATVREGLLHILGGGVTRLGRPDYPGPLGVALALRLVIHPTEQGVHNGLVLIQGEDGQRYAEINFEFTVTQETVTEADLLPGEEMSLPFVVPLHNIGMPAPGRYAVELLIDQHHLATIPFAMNLIE